MANVDAFKLTDGSVANVILGDAAEIATNSDLNDMSFFKTGIYKSPASEDNVATLSNCPVSSPFTMIVTSSKLSDEQTNYYGAVQTIITHNRMFTRAKSSIMITPWNEYLSVGLLDDKFIFPLYYYFDAAGSKSYSNLSTGNYLLVVGRMGTSSNTGHGLYVISVSGGNFNPVVLPIATSDVVTVTAPSRQSLTIQSSVKNVEINLIRLAKGWES